MSSVNHHMMHWHCTHKCIPMKNKESFYDGMIVYFSVVHVHDSRTFNAQQTFFTLPRFTHVRLSQAQQHELTHVNTSYYMAQRRKHNPEGECKSCRVSMHNSGQRVPICSFAVAYASQCVEYVIPNTSLPFPFL